MFGKRITLFHVFGFAIRIDASWVILAVLITTSLGAGTFPSSHPGLPAAVHWMMGVAGALGLFVSILLHELSHSLVARAQGVPMTGITLFIFGGVAEMEGEPESPRSEFLIAVVGPIASVVIAVALLGAWIVGGSAGWPAGLLGVLQWLGVTNLFLAGFNLVPAFPLDGGRILRSALWAWRGDLRGATRVAAGLGRGFGTLLVIVGVVQVVVAHDFNGAWLFLIGLFLRMAATGPYQQVVVRQALEGAPVRRFMKTDLVTVPRGIPVRELVEDYLYRHHHEMFPVVEGDRLLGCVGVDHVKSTPREEWDRQSVGMIMSPCTAENTIGPDEDATIALRRMGRAGGARLMVVDGDRLLGIITLRDLVAFLSLKMELEDG